MAGRFEHLEFDEGQQDMPQPPKGPQQPDALHYLHLANEDSRWAQFESALRFYTQCLQEDRRVIEAWTGQVRMLVQLGEYHEARLWSDKALELFRGNGELLSAKAQACVRMKDKKAAYACSDASIQATGASVWRWQARGEVLLACREQTSEVCFQKALAEPQADWFDRVIVAAIYLFYGRPTKAFGLARQAVEMNSDHGYAWYTLGECQRCLGLYGQAYTSFRRCLELRPGYKQAALAIGTIDEKSWFSRLVDRFLRSGR